MEDDWGKREFDYANTPLGWAFTVLRTLRQVIAAHR
jgi:hypothetical protein